MGNVTGPEHKAQLSVFRSQIVAMIDKALVCSDLPGENLSLRRLRLLRDQLQNIPLPMLAYFTKKWVSACHAIIRSTIPDNMDLYIEELKHAKLKLPEHGSGADVYNVFIELALPHKYEILCLVHLTHQHALKSIKIANEGVKVGEEHVIEIWV
jgi:hypothetical protein